MKLPQLKKGKWNYLAFAFAFPCVGMLVLMMIAGYVPFGNRSMLYSDMWHQYFPFFKAFRQALLSGDSLLYSWNVGMGMDYLGLISYYLSSPLNLLSILVPEGFELHYFALLMPIKLGLAGLFFAIFLKKIFGKDDLSLPLFGAFYATCAWALGYQWNVMWLDTFALLPLVALGTVSLLKEKKFALYTITLFLSIYANYYIGFFTCIFVLLTFICYQICRQTSWKQLFLDFVRIGIFTMLAIGMTAILSLPALAALQSTQSSVNSPLELPSGSEASGLSSVLETFGMNVVDSTLSTNAKIAWASYQSAKEAGEPAMELWITAMKLTVKPLLTGMRQVAGNMGGGIEPTFKEGLPNLYCGIGTIILSFLFLTTRHVKLRDKICAVAMLLFFILSFLLRQLDYIWHGFHFTNMIPYRFSFLFSFVMLYMAYRAYLLRRRFRLWQLLVAAVLALGLFYCSDKRSDTVFIAYNLVFWLLYLSVFLYARVDSPMPKDADKETIRQLCLERKQRRKLSGVFLACVMGVELILNLISFGVSFPYTSLTNSGGTPTYPRGHKYTESVIRYMKEREDELFYRAEVTHAQTLNDAALNNYNGISTFTSSANVKVTEFMKALGYGAKNTYNRYCFEESSPVANLFLGLKYMIEREARLEPNNYFDEVYHYDDVYLLENNAYLPLGFLAEKELGELAFENIANAFTFQNALFRAATGVTGDVWTVNHGMELTIKGSGGINISSQNSSGYCSYASNSTSNGSIIYTLVAQEEGLLCLDLNLSARNSYSVSINDSYLFSESISLPQTIAACQVIPGDVVKINVTCEAGKSGSLNIKTGVLNDAIFREGYEVLSSSTLELTKFSNTWVEGTIDCTRDGLLYTSIPQDGNWIAYVDGKYTEPTTVGGAMIAVELTEGTHHVVFSYRNEAFSLGWRISLFCLVIFCGIVSVKYYFWPKRPRGRYERR